MKASHFIDGLCAVSDPVGCVEEILTAERGVQALKQAIRVDVTISFMNASIHNLLLYLRHPDVASACGGDLLYQTLQHMASVSTFWTQLRSHAVGGVLNPALLESYAWMLLSLLSTGGANPTLFVAIASDAEVQEVLFQSDRPETRNYLQNIRHVLRNLTVPESPVEGPGGRHSNDFAEYRKIAVLPPVDEIVSAADPFLRFPDEVENTPNDRRLSVHLDNQFRLLREDMIRELKEELAGQNRRKSQRIGGLRWTNIDFNDFNQWALEFTCPQGLFFLPKSKDQDVRKEYLKNHRKILAHGALACILVDNAVTSLGTIWRREDLIAQDPPLIHVHIPNDDTIVRQTLRSLRHSGQIELLPLHTAMFAYEPILRQLQITRVLPLAEEIMQWSPSCTAPATELSGSLKRLTDLLSKDPQLELINLLSLSKSVQLDSDQAASLVAGLTQRVTLVQGPPGTGKSFIGALIAKALHMYTEARILVLSYTNHALDQYLEDLISIGIPRTDIVRLGSVSKASAATKSLMLMEQTKATQNKLTRHDWNLINAYRDVMTVTGEKLRTSLGEYIDESAKHEDMMEYLEFSNKFQDFFEAFTLPTQGSFETVGKKGKRLDKFYLLQCWANGRRPKAVLAHVSSHERIWALSSEDRSKLLKVWLTDILEDRLTRFVDYGQQYNAQILAARRVRGENGRRVMQKMRIIGCTTTAAAKMVSDLPAAGPEIIIVEEAGEILESHILAALGPSTQQLILIGDHRQLRAKAHYDLSVEKGTGYDLNRSLFERLILKNYPHQTLSQQHRMRPEISALVRALTYPSLSDAPSTSARAAIRGMQDNIVFLDHTSLETEGSQAYDPRQGGVSSSKTNAFEAEMTLKCVKYLAQQGYRSDQIVVLSPYLGQLRLLFDVLQTENDPVLNDLDSYDLVRAGLMPAATAKAQRNPLRISTIDNYQGEESDIVIASLTRSNARGDIGFMSAPERLNVLISRARDGLILLGNSRTFLAARKGNELWDQFFLLLRNGCHVYDGLPVQCVRHPANLRVLTGPDQFEQFCPDGGCFESCDAMLNCGLHRCPSKCHQLHDHSRLRCQTILSDVCGDGHPRSWPCSSKQPLTCKVCELARVREERRKRCAYERQRAEADRQQQLDAKLAKLDEEIERERNCFQKEQSRQDAEDVVRQKVADLEQARKATALARNNHETRRSGTAGASQATDHPQTLALATSAKVDRKSHEVSTPSQAMQAWISAKTDSGAVSRAVDKLMEMTGLESVKKWVVQIFQKLETARRQGIDLKQERFGTILLGNPGTGKTTVARVLADFFAEVDILPTTKFVETSGAKLAHGGVMGSRQVLDDLLKAGGGVIFIDEAYQLVSGHSHGGGAVLDFWLAEIENTVGRVIFMFAGYDKQMEKFFQHNPGLRSRMPHQLKFEDYSESELLHMLGQKIVKKFNGRMDVEDGVTGLYMRIVVRRLHRLSGREGFGNARALENVVDRITSAQADRLSRERQAGLCPNDFYLSREDVIGPEPQGILDHSLAWQQLQQMIGLKSVKEAVQTLLERLSLNYQRELVEQPILEVSLNRLFLGSPGTGKTTVAKLYGQILAEIGVLSSCESVTKTPSDFIGSVLGESEKNTRAILDNTKGKVLIVDEAYMLSASTTKADLYRTAVVDTIVSEIHSVPGDDRAVLLLGYEEQMKELLRHSNPGLARRFPVESAFYFEDFDDAQLLQVLDMKMKVQGIQATEAAKSTAIGALSKLRRQPNFGNAGEVENLLSRAKEAHSQRRTSTKDSGADITLEPIDFDPDVGRSVDAIDNCRALFQDTVGAEELVEKLIGYIRSAMNARQAGIDPEEILPFNFVFKGPPGKCTASAGRTY